MKKIEGGQLFNYTDPPPLPLPRIINLLHNNDQIEDIKILFGANIPFIRKFDLLICIVFLYLGRFCPSIRVTLHRNLKYVNKHNR